MTRADRDQRRQSIKLLDKEVKKKKTTKEGLFDLVMLCYYFVDFLSFPVNISVPKWLNTYSVMSLHK